MDAPQHRVLVGVCHPSNLFPSFKHACTICGLDCWYPRTSHKEFQTNPLLHPVCSLCFFVCLAHGQISKVQPVQRTPQEMADDSQFQN